MSLEKDERTIYNQILKDWTEAFEDDNMITRTEEEKCNETIDLNLIDGTDLSILVEKEILDDEDQH